MGRIKKLMRVLDSIEEDRLQLKRKGQLTEYGQGELDLIKKVRRELNHFCRRNFNYLKNMNNF
jgi:hypothetical protein